MRLPLPNTLFSRLMLIWLVGISLVLATSIALFRGERDRHSRDLIFEGAAREIASTLNALDRLPADQRANWIGTMGKQRLRYSLAEPPPSTRPLPRSDLSLALERSLGERHFELFSRHGKNGGTGRGHRLFIATALADGQPLSIVLPPFPPELDAPVTPERALAALVSLVTGISLLAWLAVRLATRPLSRLADAARALGEDPERPAMDTHGPAEVELAARAFNQMQQRIRQHVGERTRILASISHDLQTPITRLRLRAELVDDDNLRSRIQSDLDAMQALVREGLDYARSMDTNEPHQLVDLNALVASLCDDATDMGWAVAIRGETETPCRCQPQALKRALWNLVENGIKFGSTVDITISQSEKSFIISVRDHGVGLPEAELDKVFEPFYRSESSRNRETGGTGLGLAITKNLLKRQGATIRLKNMTDGGLLAEVALTR